MIYAAFLRAVNVGKHNRVRMDALRELVTGLGYGEVRTYLQTGNLAFDARRDDAETVAGRLEAALLGAQLSGVDAIVRTRAELDRLLLTDPFADHPAEQYYRYVILTREPVEAELPLELGRVSVLSAVPGALLAVHPKPSERTPNANALVESQWKVRATTRFWNVLEDFVTGPLAEVGRPSAGARPGAA